MVVEAEASAPEERGPKLTKNQSTYLEMVRAHQPIQTDDLNDRLRDAGIGLKRPADLVDLRLALRTKGLIYESMNGWCCIS